MKLKALLMTIPSITRADSWDQVLDHGNTGNILTKDPSFSLVPLNFEYLEALYFLNVSLSVFIL